MIEEDQVLRIAGRKPIVVFRDFIELQPMHSGGYHYLFHIKEHLLNNGYICHEARHRSKWDCDYEYRYTHFHKPGSGFKSAQG